MGRRITWIAAVYLLSLLLVMSAVAQGQGTIEGQVTNGTADGGSVEGLEVTLTALSGGEVKDTFTATTDATGRFRFEDLDTAATLTYGVAVSYQGVSYDSSEPVGFSDQTMLFVPLKVYDATTSDEDIVIARAHFIIDFQSKLFMVTEVFFVANTGDRTYVGSAGEGGHGGTVRFSLPAGAEGLQFRDPEASQRYLPVENGFVDRSPVRPGGEPEQVLFSYHVRYDSSAFGLSTDLIYPISDINVLVADVGAEVTSEQVAFESKMGGQGQSYLNLTGQNLPEDTTLVLNFTNLPQEVTTPGVDVVPDSSQTVLLWIAGGLLALAVALGFGYPLLRRRAESPAARSAEPLGGVYPERSLGPQDRLTAKPLEQERRAVDDEIDLEVERQELLLEMARLDDDFEDGKIDEDEYERERAEIKAELVAVMRQLKGRE